MSYWFFIIVNDLFLICCNIIVYLLDNLLWILWKVFHQIGKYFKLLKYDMLLPNNIKHSNNNIHIVFIWNETLLISQWNNACSSLNEVFEIYEYDLTWTAL